MCFCSVAAVWFPVQKTKSGLFIPEKAQGKVNEATVVAIGGGARDKVTVGDERLICIKLKIEYLAM